MLRPEALPLGLLLALLLAPARAEYPVAQDELRRLAQQQYFDQAYDGARSAPSSAAPATTPVAGATPSAPQTGLVPALRGYDQLREAKALLDDSGSVSPFVFHPNDGAAQLTAPSAGLEGFVYGERQAAAGFGRDALLHHEDDYAHYLDALLAPVSWADGAKTAIDRIESGPGTPLEKYGRLVAFANQLTDQLRAAVAKADKAAWVRTARIYELFPRAYNLEGRHAASALQGGGRFFAEFGARDLKDIRDMGFNTIWVMGIYPIGKRNAEGTAGGSPFSIQDHESVNPELGTPAEFKAFVERAHRLGMRVILDYVVNHTSMDSKLLAEDPNYFLHRPAGDGPAPYGYFDYVDPLTGEKLWIRHGGYDSYGSLAFWEDTAQLDYSNVRTRRRVIQIAEKWVRDYHVDGFRADVAYQLLNRYFGKNWNIPMPKREFLDELTTEIKSKYPGTAFIAEAYDGWDEVSRCGFDLIYGKNDMNRPGGHAGWYDAVVSRDPSWIRRAIRRLSFLDWQDGGADMLIFTGNHDEASPQRALGPWSEGATFLTLLQTGPVLFYGSQEIGFDQPAPNEPKSIPFSVPVKVDWSKADPKVKAFHDQTFRLSREIHALLGPSDMQPIPAEGEPPWVGYLLVSRAPRALRAAAVIANPTGADVDVQFSDPDRGIEYHGTLPAFGYRLIRF